MQTKVAQKAADYISRTIDHDVTIGRVDLEFFSNLVLEQVRVADNRDNEMFYVGRAEADISVFSIFDPRTLHIATLELQEPRANLVIYEGTDTLNLSSFIQSLGDLIVKDTTKASQPFNFSIDELVIQNGRFTYDNFNNPRTDFGVDYQHMTFDKISGTINEIDLGDTLRTRITGLTTHETRSDTRLHKLDVLMAYAPTYWEFDELDLQVNESNLKNYLRFDYNTFGNFSSFIDSVHVTARIQNSTVLAQDIAVFAPQLREMDDKAIINSGNYKGLVSEFSATDLDVYYGENTHIVGSISADGLPNYQETFANIRLRESSINANDIREFLPQDAYEIASRLGTVNVEGRFLGFYTDFVANASFSTALGSLESDINMKIDEDTRSSRYEGNLKTTNFNLGRLVNNSDLVKTISMNGRVSGSGFTLQTARINLNATISQLHLLDYNYRNIRANGTLSNQKFVGKVSVNDPNLVVAADGEVNLAPKNQAFNMLADLRRLDLQALKLSDKPFVIQADANLNFKGLQLDEFVGIAHFDSARVMYDGKELALDSVHIVSEIAQGQRSLSLFSDLLTLKADGNFDYTTLIADLKQLVEEYRLNFESNDPVTDAYYARKRVAAVDEYSVNYDIYLKHINPVLHLFAPKVTVSDFSKVEGSFRYGNTMIFDMFARLDTILYDDVYLYENNFELNTSKLQQSPDVLASMLFTSSKQDILPTGETQDFYLEGIWNERNIDFSTSIRQVEDNNRATVSGALTFLENQIQIVFDRSNITLFERPWVFAPENTILISDAGRTFDFQNFTVSNRNQIINLQGIISEDPQSKLNLDIQRLDMRNLNPLISMRVAGKMDASVVVQDIYNSAIINANMRVDSFLLDNVWIGDIIANSDWNRQQQQMVIDAGIERDEKKVLSLTGNYNPYEEENQLDLLAVLEDSHLKIVEPILRPIVSNLEGGMDGRIRVVGRLDSPVLTGSVMVNNGFFTFDYLGTTYQFSDRIYFGQNTISFRNARVRDIYGNYATVSGGITHDGFQDMIIDMEARYRNFMVLNTTMEQNELYYGTAFGSGTASILGPVNNLKINVKARSDANTRIVVPLDNQEDAVRKDFIRFVNRNVTDTTGLAVEVVEQGVDLSGINMDFDLDVTDDAYFEIIIDRTTGDIIRGSGNGQIKMTIDTRGDFNMYGAFEIATGAYNLNLLEGLVTREFRVLPGGTLSWNGDPLEGTMNLKASYTQITSLSNIIPQDLVAARGAYPVTAVIDLKGALLTPEITLGLNFDEVPQDISSLLDNYISGLRTNQNELDRQVFSLLVFRRLSPQGTFAFAEGGAGGVGGSLGNLLSSQLSTLLNNIDSNLQVDIGVGGLNQESLANIQVRLSYSLLNGRLRVTSQTGLVSGATDGTGSPTGARGQNNYQGEWSLEYYLTQSGELRARLEYSTTPQVISSRIQNRQSLSLLHTKRFDNLRELFGSDRRSRRRRMRDQDQEIPVLDSDPRLKL